MRMLNRNKVPKNQEFGFIRNAVIYLVCAIGSFYLHIWLFGIVFLALTAFNGFMAYKHFGEPTAVNKGIIGVRNFLDKDYDYDNVEFGNIETDNKAYNAQKRWNELEKARNEKLYGAQSDSKDSTPADLDEYDEDYDDDDIDWDEDI